MGRRRPAAELPVTVFDRTDGQPNRWPTFGIKLSSQPPVDVPDKAVHGDISELLAIAHTALGEWNRYALADDGVSSRTIWVDTMHVSATDFHIDASTQNDLYTNGRGAAAAFLTRGQPRTPTQATQPPRSHPEPR